MPPTTSAPAATPAPVLERLHREIAAAARHPDVARRIAELGAEPGGNSAFRLADVWGRIGVGPAMREHLGGLRGPILLVDDLADSRWTLTVAAAELRAAGAAAVLPFTLALEA